MDSNSLIQDLVDLVNNFDPLSLLPDVTTMFGWVETFCRICVLASPAVMLFFGLWYLLLPPKEANRSAGWRFYFGMGSVEAWRFSQRLAGGIWCLVGLGLAIWMALAGPKLVDMALLDRMGQMAFYIFCQAMALLLSRWIINLLVFLRYDAKGRRRYTWAELWKG